MKLSKDTKKYLLLGGAGLAAVSGGFASTLATLGQQVPVMITAGIALFATAIALVGIEKKQEDKAINLATPTALVSGAALAAGFASIGVGFVGGALLGVGSFFGMLAFLSVLRGWNTALQG